MSPNSNLICMKGSRARQSMRRSLTLIQCLNGGVLLSAGIRPTWGHGRGRSDCHSPLTLHLTCVLHWPSSNTQSKDKEGPNTAKRSREGTERKDKKRATLVGTKQSRKSDIKEQVRKHLKREKEKKNESPSQSAIYILKHLDKLKRSFTRSMSVASLLLIILERKCPRCRRLRTGTSLFLSNQTWMLPIVVLWFSETQLWTPEQKVSRKTIFV